MRSKIESGCSAVVVAGGEQNIGKLVTVGKFIGKTNMRILHLTLHKKWFDEIASGSKVFEYRKIEPYWTKRLMDGDKFKEFDEIHYVNGYGSHRPKMIVKFLGTGYGEFEGRRVYAIGNGEIYSIKNYSPN